MLIHTKVLLLRSVQSTSYRTGVRRSYTVIWGQETNKHRFVTVQIVLGQMLRGWLWLQAYEEAITKTLQECKTSLTSQY